MIDEKIKEQEEEKQEIDVNHAEESDFDSFMNEVDEVMDKENTDEIEDDNKDLSSNVDELDKEEPDKELESEEDDGLDANIGDEVPEIDDELLERAIRSGLSLDDAKSFNDKDVLARIIERFETSSKTFNDKSSKNEVDNNEGDNDNLLEMQDLNPDDFLEEQVEAFSSMKRVILEQQKAIKRLQDSSIGASNNGWEDAKFNGLDKEYKEVFGRDSYSELPKGEKQQKARDKLRRYMDFAIEEAKVDGISISKDEAFKKALESGFSDFTNKIKGKLVKENARNRSSKVISKPRSSAGEFVSKSNNLSEEDRDREAIGAIEEMMTQK